MRIVVQFITVFVEENEKSNFFSMFKHLLQLVFLDIFNDMN